MALTNEWHVSTRSGASGSCVRARLTGDDIEIGDSKNPDGASLFVDPEAWMDFVGGIQDGDWSTDKG